MAEKVIHQAPPATAVEVERPALAGIRGLTAGPPVVYPSDEPRTFSTWHKWALLYARPALQLHFGADGDIFVAADFFVYYVEGDPTKRVAPDVMAAWGIRRPPRSSYRVWDVGRAPEFVLDVLAEDRHLAEARGKRRIYEEMGVREYFVYDPLGRTMASQPGGRRLRGERLAGGVYRELPREADGSIRSEVLGLALRVKRRETSPEWRQLRFRIPETGEDLPTASEERALRIEAEQRTESALRDIERFERQIKEDREATRRTELKAKQEREATRKAELKAKRDREATRRAQLKSKEHIEATRRAQLRSKEDQEATRKLMARAKEAGEALRKARQRIATLEARLARQRAREGGQPP